MKRFYLIHRWSGGALDDWRPWLKSELEKMGHKVFVPDMPDTEVPVIEKWVNYLDQIVGTADENTFFVGHSIGCQAILRYLEKKNNPIGGAIFVAGWFKLENLEDDEVKKIARPWTSTPIDTGKIKRILPWSIVFISDNDPFGAFEENQKKFKEIGSKLIVIPGAKHFTEAAGFTKLPQILEELNNNLS